MVMAAMEKNIFEHISLMAQEQIELEFRDELPQMQMMAQNPQMQMQLQEMQQRIEARKAVDRRNDGRILKRRERSIHLVLVMILLHS